MWTNSKLPPLRPIHLSSHHTDPHCLLFLSNPHLFVSHFPFLRLSWVILSHLFPHLSLSRHIFFLLYPIVLSSLLLSSQALSGDSTINPSLGRLVLQCLCPALHSLLTDGLKPHQSDLIAGRRPNSAWGLVQASTRPGRTPRIAGKLTFIDLDIIRLLFLCFFPWMIMINSSLVSRFPTHQSVLVDFSVKCWIKQTTGCRYRLPVDCQVSPQFLAHLCKFLCLSSSLQIYFLLFLSTHFSRAENTGLVQPSSSSWRVAPAETEQTQVQRIPPRPTEVSPGC